MSVTSILRIDHDGEPISLLRYDAQNAECQEILVTQWTDQSLSGLKLTVLVPASWVYHSQTAVPSKNIEVLTKSIPYAIEEELSNEVESNYFAFAINEDTTQRVIAIERKHLDKLNELILAHRLDVEYIYSEVDWLPVAPSEVTILSDEESAILKLDGNQAMRVANTQINQLLPVFAAEKQQIKCNERTVIDYADLPVDKSLTIGDCCHYLLNQQPINLFNEALKVNQPQTKSTSLNGVFILLAVLLLSWITVQAIQWNALKQSISEIKQQQQNVLRQNHPNAVAAEMVDPYAALLSRLQVNNNQSTSSNSMLIKVVNQLGQTMKQQKSVKLMSMRLIDNKMELQINAPNMTAINDFHQLLQQYANDFTIKVGVNELSDDNTFKSILTVVPR